jgi:hypothetical protein
MTSAQLAAIAYQLGVIDNIRIQLHELVVNLDHISEGPLSVKLELALRAFDERAADHRRTLNEYTDEIPIDPPPSREGRQTPPGEQESL